MLISDEYRAVLARKHAQGGGFGTSGAAWASLALDLAQSCGEIPTLLDYGCGKSMLGTALKMRARPGELVPSLTEYDPAIPGKDSEPAPADIVMCTDVLEHVEPDCLDEVLDHLQTLARRFVVFNIPTLPAFKTLPDGRNAHLIVEPMSWWLPKLEQRWRMARSQGTGKGFVFIGVPR